MRQLIAEKIPLVIRMILCQVLLAVVVRKDQVSGHQISGRVDGTIVADGQWRSLYRPNERAPNTASMLTRASFIDRWMNMLDDLAPTLEQTLGLLSSMEDHAVAATQRGLVWWRRQLTDG